MAAVQGLFSRGNPHFGIHRSAIETHALSEAIARVAGRDPNAENRCIFFRTTYSPDPLPPDASAALMEVAAILPDTTGEARGGHDIAVSGSRYDVMIISATHSSYGPLAYPLLNPTGGADWHHIIDLCRSHPTVEVARFGLNVSDRLSSSSEELYSSWCYNFYW